MKTADRGIVLVTGAAGFIGFHVVSRLLIEGFTIVGIDSINDYYSQDLKWARLAQLGVVRDNTMRGVLTESTTGAFRFMWGDLAKADELKAAIHGSSVDIVINLAAQAGVRYSVINPMAYVQANVVGFQNILELSIEHKIRHLIFASSSSVYGEDALPYKENSETSRPLSIYAATKKMNELMAHAYTKTHGLKSTGLRFFTVYGPWGRPDMAYFKFSERLLSKQPIALHAGGEMIRDFTYIDDIVEVIFRFVDKETDKQEAEASLASSSIFNIGKGAPELVTDMLRYLERFLDTRGIYEAVSKESSEPYATHADTARLEEYIGYRPVVDLEEGMRRFVQWYVDYYKIKNGPDIKSRDL